MLFQQYKMIHPFRYLIYLFFIAMEISFSNVDLGKHSNVDSMPQLIISIPTVGAHFAIFSQAGR